MEEIAEMKVNKKIRKVCLISKSLFAITAKAYGWTEPLGAMFGMISDITEDKPESLQKEMETATNQALELLYKNAPSNTYKKIAKELMAYMPNPDNIDEMMTKAMEYQEEYYTDNDKKNVMALFDRYFSMAASGMEQLSRYYTLSTGAITKDNVLKVYKLLQEDDEKLDNIQNDVTEIKGMGTKAFECIMNSARLLSNTVSVVLASMAVFLFLGTALFRNYNRDMMWFVLLGYGAAEVLMYFWDNEKITFFSRITLMRSMEKEKRWTEALRTVLLYILPIISVIVVFWLTYGMGSETMGITSFELAAGSFAGIIFRETKYNDIR